MRRLRIAGGRRVRIAASALAAGCLLLIIPAVALAQADAFSMEGVFGKGSDLQMAPDGTLQFEADKNSQLTKLIAKKEVRLRSDKFNMDCDQLVYTAATHQVVAYGTPVVIVKDDINARCKSFEYYTDQGKMVFMGDPIIQQKMKNGEFGPKVSGKKITIIQKPDGGIEMLVDAGSPSLSGDLPAARDSHREATGKATPARLEMDASPTKTPKPTAPPAAAEPVSSLSTSKIPEVSPGE